MDTPPAMPNAIGLCASATFAGARPSMRTIVSAIVGGRSNRICRLLIRGSASEGLQVLDEIPLLSTREADASHLHVVLDHVIQRLRASIVEVRPMLPQAAKWGRAVR